MNHHMADPAQDLDAQRLLHTPDIFAQPQRRPRGFAVTSIGTGTTSARTKNRKQREKDEEKERTKLRERHRRAITTRILAGLRQYGNFHLPARADMNDVIAALAREARWTVEPDGTTYRQSPTTPPQPKMQAQVAHPAWSVESPIYSSSLKDFSMDSSVDPQPTAFRVNENFSPASLDSVAADRNATPECLAGNQLVKENCCRDHGNGTSGTFCIPVFVRLASGLVNNFCQLMDPEGIKKELQQLKSLNVDGVLVDCWWGIVEARIPSKYEWGGYRQMFNIILDHGMKLQVVMAFHEYGEHDSGGIFISLPQWVLEIGRSNQDIFFTDREGRRNTQCLSWGIDKERVLRGRTCIEVHGLCCILNQVYFDFMRSFRTEFDDLFNEGLISSVEVGLGASGQLKYPSFSERTGWRYPGIGEFQCYDKYLLQNLQKAAKLRGHSIWGRVPDNAGYYNSKPHETGFFCERGDYNGYYGRFFLNWYSRVLIDHANNVLSLATLAFEGTQLVVKIPAVHWWYKTASHAAELTAGYYNPSNQDGYSPLFEVLKKHGVTMKFVIPGLQSSQEINEACSDLESLSWQVLNSAWDRRLSTASQIAQPCSDRVGLMSLVEMARPRNHPYGGCFSFFVFQQLSPLIRETVYFSDLQFCIKCMHGEVQDL